ncbi:MAG: site-specific DNA-methyltransferase [Treponema sp.]|nr:site-specific DNA-methyltransferase [Treponema sp.]
MRRIIDADALEALRTLPEGIADMCVTSPPYYGLRDYGVEGQIGMEETPDAYIHRLVEVFREVRRVLWDDGTLWVNIADAYAGSGKGSAHYPESSNKYKQGTNKGILDQPNLPRGYVPAGCKPKDLIGIPWMLAFALRADGWYLRQDIIWHKPNPMPESVTDRCTKAHEYIFLLSKSANYYYDNEAIKEPAATHNNLIRDRDSSRLNNTPGRKRMGGLVKNDYAARNKRNVWTIATGSCKEAHFAVFPESLILPCILAGSRVGGIVLDPFIGTGTTAVVAIKTFRNYIGCEINPGYIKLAEKRIAIEKGLWDDAALS